MTKISEDCEKNRIGELQELSMNLVLEKEQIVHFLHDVRDEALCRYSIVPDKNAHCNDNHWSANQILRHLEKSEIGIAKIFRSADRVCRQHIPMPKQDIAPIFEKMKLSLLNRKKKTTAPESVVPEDVLPSQNMVEDITRSRRFLLENIMQFDDLALASYSFRHPLLGDLPLIMWIAFIALHELRHTEQLGNIDLLQQHSAHAVR